MFDRRQGPPAEAEAEFDSLRDREAALGVDVRSAARELRARVEAAHARARHYLDRLLPAHRRVLEQTLRQYNAMQLGVFELLSARRLALEAELGQVAAVRDYWTAVAALDALLSGRRVDAGPTDARMTTAAASPRSGGH